MKTRLPAPTVLAVVSLVVTLGTASAPAQEKAPKPDTSDATPFAYAAPAFIKELDSRYPAQPPSRRNSACLSATPVSSSPPRKRTRCANAWPKAGVIA